MKSNIDDMIEMLSEYLRLSDQILKIDIFQSENGQATNTDLESLQNLEELVYKREQCLDKISENSREELFEDFKLNAIYQDCIFVNTQVEEKLSLMLEDTNKLISNNFEDMSKQGKTKIALKHYLKSQDLDGISNFYLDKKK